MTKVLFFEDAVYGAAIAALERALIDGDGRSGRQRRAGPARARRPARAAC